MEEGALIQFQTVLVMIQVLEPAHLATMEYRRLKVNALHVTNVLELIVQHVLEANA